MKAFRFQTNAGGATALAGIVSASAVSLVLLLVWLTADPEAHEYFHHDADHCDHHCVISDYAAGEGYYVVPSISVPPVLAVCGAAHFSAREAPREPVGHLLLPICGPPAGAGSL